MLKTHWIVAHRKGGQKAAIRKLRERLGRRFNCYTVFACRAFDIRFNGWHYRVEAVPNRVADLYETSNRYIGFELTRLPKAK